MAHYFTDFVNPPPFGQILPGAIGYVSEGGLTVLYGQKTRGDIQRQNHLGFVPFPVKPAPFKSKVVDSLELELKRQKDTRDRIREDWEQSRKSLDAPIHPVKTITPKLELPLPKIAYPSQPKAHRKFVCRSCGAHTHLCNRHHPMPQEIKRTRATVRLCFECHGVIHYIPNTQLAQMPWESQMRFIQDLMLIQFG